MKLTFFVDRDKKFRVLVVLITMILLVVFIIVYLALDIRLTCLLIKTTGIWCPLCGGTRSFINLTHGNISTAFKYNELFISTLPLTIMYCISKTIEYIKTGCITVSKNVIKYSSLIMLLYMIIRNMILIQR